MPANQPNPNSAAGDVALHRNLSSPVSSPSHRLQTIFLWTGRVLALALLAFCPWFYGMVTWQAQVWLVPWVAAISLCGLATNYLAGWSTPPAHQGCVARSWTNPFVLVLMLLLALAFLQSLPLPEAVWSKLSAGAAFEREVTKLATEYEAFLPTFEPAENGLPSAETDRSNFDWKVPPTLSLHPVQTRASTAVFACAIAMIISGYTLFPGSMGFQGSMGFRGSVGPVLLLSTIALTAVANTLLGLFQSLAGRDWSLLEMPTDTYFATFVSRNSAPQFIAIGIGASTGLLLWWVDRKRERRVPDRHQLRYPALGPLARVRYGLETILKDVDALSAVLAVAIGLQLVAVVAAGSKGGMLACCIAGLITLLATFRTGGVVSLRRVGLVIVIGLVVLVGYSLFGLDEVAKQRLDNISQATHEQTIDNGRFDLWKMSLSRPSYWLAGCGLGAYHFGILPCYDRAGWNWFYHAESVYVELLVELGIPGFVVGLAGLAWLAFYLSKSLAKSCRNIPIVSANCFAISAVALHSLVDFSLIIPAIFLPLASMVGCMLASTADQAPEGVPTQRKNGPGYFRVANLMQLACLVLIGTAICRGYGSLRGFAIAERLEREFQDAGENQNLQDSAILKRASQRQYITHPEVALQLGRIEQNYFQQLVIESNAWPEDTALSTKSALARPETVSAAMRGGTAGVLVALAEVMSHERLLVEELSLTCRRMQLVIANCSMDWRGSWGILRSDVGQLTAAQRARNYARLVLTTKHLPDLQQSIGSTAMWAGEDGIGVDVWRRNLAANPRGLAKVAPLVGVLFNSHDLNTLLPQSGFYRADLARQLLSQVQQRTAPDGVDDIAQSLLETVEIAQLERQAQSSGEWQTIAWLAEREGNAILAIDAYKRAIGRSPSNFDLHYKRAKLLESKGRLVEARDQMRTAGRLSTNKAYQDYLKELNLRVQKVDESESSLVQ